MGISNEQKALVHVAKTQLGLEDDIYREILRQEAGVNTARDLSPIGLDNLMKRFRQLGFKKAGSQRSQRKVPHPFGTITKPMLDKIQHLYEDIGWEAKSRQIGFSNRMIKKPWPQTKEEGIKIIEGLKAILARNNKAGGQ